MGLWQVIVFAAHCIEMGGVVWSYLGEVVDGQVGFFAIDELTQPDQKEGDIVPCSVQKNRIPTFERLEKS
jgi:hypothetical protein